MVCDYYTETSIVIDYISIKGEICKIVTNTKRTRGFIDKKYQYNTDKYKKKLENYLENNSYIKMIYENKIWLHETYQNKYETKLRKWFPHIKDFIKIYKDSIAWSVK